MRTDRLQDTIHRGLGRAALVLGTWCDLYRPVGADTPLDRARRILRLPATFTAHNPDRPVSYGQATWQGVFDAAYTRPGDYLVRPSSQRGRADGGVWFVAAQQPLAPILCVRASRVVSFARPAAPAASGVNAYGGVTTATATPLARSWPASVLAASASGVDSGLPSDGAPGSWTVLLPAVASVAFRNGDLMTDDLGRTGIVSSAELTDLGWRLLVKQTTT